jgi:hypothetical protein
MVMLNLPPDVDISFNNDDLPRIREWVKSHPVPAIAKASKRVGFGHHPDYTCDLCGSPAEGACVYCAEVAVAKAARTTKRPKASRPKSATAKAAKPKVTCSLCDGSGKIREGHVTCPDCKGKGKVRPGFAAEKAAAIRSRLAAAADAAVAAVTATKSVPQSGWLLPAFPVPPSVPGAPAWDSTAATFDRPDPGVLIRGEDVFGDMRYDPDPANRILAQDQYMTAGVPWQ